MTYTDNPAVGKRRSGFGTAVEFLKHHLLTVGVSAVVLLLAVIIGLQLYSLERIERFWGAYAQLWRQSYLSEVAGSVESHFRQTADVAFGEPLTDLSDESLKRLETRFANSRSEGVRKVFWTAEGTDLCERKQCIFSSSRRSRDLKKLNLPADLVNVDDVKFSPSGEYLLVQDSINGIDNLRIFRVRKGSIVGEIPRFVSGSFVIWNTRWLSDNELAYTLENNGKPASIQSYNIDTRRLTDWTKELLPVQLEGKVRAPEIIRWKSFDGREIAGYIVRPKSFVKKSPVLIFIHGGPQILDKPVFNSFDIRLASNLGLTTIHTNIRGSSGLGDDFMDADNKENRGDAVKDVQSLLDWIGDQTDLDSSRIFIRGESYGGYIALSTGLQEPRRIKAVVAEYPLVSIRGFLAQSWIDEFAKNEYGDPKDETLMTKLDQLSPLNNVGRWNNIPLLLTRGKLDSRNPEKDVTDLKNQLQKRGSEVWYIYSTKDGHGFGSKYVAAAMYIFLKQQLNKVNQGETKLRK